MDRLKSQINKLDLAVYSSAISKDDKNLCIAEISAFPLWKDIYFGRGGKEFSTVVAIGGPTARPPAQACSIS